MIKINVTKPGVLLDFLAENTSYTRGKLKSLLKHECIYINDTLVTQFNHVLKEGDTIDLLKFNHQLDSLVEVLYEDDQVIAIFKPAGLLTIANQKESLHTAYRYTSDYLKQKDPRSRVFIVHRLDQETSGVLLFAKSEKVQTTLQAKWSDTKRYYLAVVEGQVEKEKDVIELSIDDSQSHRVFTGNKNGKDAKTQYTRISTNNEYSLLMVQLLTGRKHQIRAHMEGIGHPVTGDKRYGAKENPFKRLGLHGYIIDFRHPTMNKRVVVEADVPKAFTRMFKTTPRLIKQAL